MSFLQPNPSSPTTGPFDPRAICNLILDEADREGRGVTNLALQKLLYFAHGQHLVETKKPLVSGFFEAWRFGPVHPIAYASFKDAGSKPIKNRAIGRDPFTGQERPLAIVNDALSIGYARRIASMYSRMSAGRLVDISHAAGGPWDFIVTKAKESAVLGMRIPNDIIAARFKHHKVAVHQEPKYGEPTKDVPLVGKQIGARRAFGS